MAPVTGWAQPVRRAWLVLQVLVRLVQQVLGQRGQFVRVPTVR